MIHLFLAFVLLKQEIWNEGTYYKKKVQMRSSVERRKLQRCVARYIKSSIKLIYYVVCWRKRGGCRNLHAMFVWEKYKTLCWLLNWIQLSMQKNAGSGERIAELWRATRQMQSVIKVNSWRLYNVYNQQDQKLSSTIWSSIKRSLRGRHLRSNSR